MLYGSGVIDYINKKLSYPVIILFGSFSKGEDVEQSDIDLFIGSPEKSIDLSGFEKKVGKKFQVFLEDDLLKIKNRHLINGILNGLVLEGFLEL